MPASIMKSTGLFTVFLSLTFDCETLAAGLFASTEAGLIALNLETLEAKSLTSEFTAAVAVNQNLEKVYWSEGQANSRIMRSNFDGSEKEIIVPLTGGHIIALAVHEPSGNIYYHVLFWSKIFVCNELGENCTTVFSSSSLADYVYSIAFDYEKDVMYWSRHEPNRTSLIRANLDGSQITVISSTFSVSTFVVIALLQPLDDTLYWADSIANTVGSMDVSGSNKRVLVELEGEPGPRAIDVDADKIYFANYNGKTVQSIGRDTGKGLTTIYNSTIGITCLALFNAPP